MRNLVVLAVLCVSLNTYAQRMGPGDPGGGDPMTQQFIVMGKQLGIYFMENPFSLVLPFDAKDFMKKVEELDDSVKDETKKDLLEFTGEILKDKDGVEKPALFHREESSVRVNRKIWQDYTDEQRLTLITMEVSGLLRSPLRYEVAHALVQNRVGLIASIPSAHLLQKTNLTSVGAWRIVGQDNEQFAKVTVHDVVIDGGSVGRGDAEEERLQKFLSEPSSDKEWYSLLEKAWAIKRPAYLIVSTNDGSVAFASSITLGQTNEAHPKAGIAIYSMVFQKQKQIYLGPCSDRDKTFNARERLLNCYIDSANYSAQDFLAHAVVKEAEAPEILATATQEAFANLRRSLEYILANNKDTVEVALRENYIYNYSDVFYGRFDYRNQLLTASLRAHSLTPSLFGPFGKSTFWIKTKKKDVAAIRLFKALQALAENDLAFMTEKFSCSKSKDSMTRDYSGPILMDLAELKNYRRLDQCTGFMQGTDRPVQQQLFETMVKAGFYYDYSSEQWLRVSK